MNNIKSLLLKLKKQYVTVILIILFINIIIENNDNLVVFIIILTLMYSLLFLYFYYIHLITEFAFKKMKVISINFKNAFNYIILTEFVLTVLILVVRDIIFQGEAKNNILKDYEEVIGTPLVFAMLLINPFILSSLLNALELKRKLRISEHFKYFGKFYFLIFNYGVMIGKFKDVYRNNLSENNIN